MTKYLELIDEGIEIVTNPFGESAQAFKKSGSQIVNGRITKVSATHTFHVVAMSGNLSLIEYISPGNAIVMRIQKMGSYGNLNVTIQKDGNSSQLCNFHVIDGKTANREGSWLSIPPGVGIETLGSVFPEKVDGKNFIIGTYAVYSMMNMARR